MRILDLACGDGELLLAALAEAERRSLIVTEVVGFDTDERGDCYWMVIDDEELAEVVMAVGNSSFCTWFYDTACDNFLYAGRRRFMTQYMERLPIPTPTPTLVEEIRALRSENRLAELDALVWSSLGLKQVWRRELVHQVFTHASPVLRCDSQRLA